MLKRKLQVFVSSTFTDLMAERQAAVAAILKAGHIPAGMELFIAGDKSQLATINRWIDESDVYLLILGGRYGSVDPATNLSYTELEYDYALQQGKPVSAMVISEAALEAKAKNGGTRFLEMENQTSLLQFRTKVLTRISSFFSDEKDVRLCVYENLLEQASNTDLKGWVSKNEVEDNKLLLNELKALRLENADLKTKMPPPSRASCIGDFVPEGVLIGPQGDIVNV